MDNNQNKVGTSAGENEFTRLLAQAMSQNPTKGLELLEQELLHHPQDQRLYRFKGMFLSIFFQRYEDSLKVFDQALQMNPQDEQSLYYKGQALAALKRYEEALQAYDQALETEETGMTYYAKGKVLYQLQRYQEALLATNESLDIFRECDISPDADVWGLKGRALVGLGCYEEAISAYDEALRLDPNNRDVYEKKEEAILALYSYIPQRKTQEEDK